MHAMLTLLMLGALLAPPQTRAGARPVVTPKNGVPGAVVPSGTIRPPVDRSAAVRPAPEVHSAASVSAYQLEKKEHEIAHWNVDVYGIHASSGNARVEQTIPGLTGLSNLVYGSQPSRDFGSSSSFLSDPLAQFESRPLWFNVDQLKVDPPSFAQQFEHALRGNPATLGWPPSSVAPSGDLLPAPIQFDVWQDFNATKGDPLSEERRKEVARWELPGNVGSTFGAAGYVPPSSGNSGGNGGNNGGGNGTGFTWDGGDEFWKDWNFGSSQTDSSTQGDREAWWESLKPAPRVEDNVLPPWVVQQWFGQQEETLVCQRCGEVYPRRIGHSCWTLIQFELLKR